MSEQRKTVLPDQAFYIVGEGVVTTFNGVEPAHWDFLRQNGKTTFSDTGFLRWLDPEDSVYGVAQTLENMS